MSENLSDKKSAAFEELEDPLRKAVEQVRNGIVPDDALKIALERASAVQDAVTLSHHPSGKRSIWKRRLSKFEVFSSLTVVVLLAALVWSATQSARERAYPASASSGEAPRRRGTWGFVDHNSNFLAGDGDVIFRDVDGAVVVEADENLHGILSDIASETNSLNGAPIAQAHVQQLPDGEADVAVNKNAPAQAGDPNPDAVPLIIYNASVSLVVDDLTATETDLGKIVDQYKGYVSSSQISHAHRQQRSAQWVVRIPVDKFNQFLDEISDLGVPEHRQTSAQDVGEEFVDLNARLANDRKLEARMLKLLDERTGDIKDVVVVEKELARVRQRIEQKQGRLKYLTNRTSMSTATISAREEKDYVPPQAPTFGHQIQSTWSDSSDALLQTGVTMVLLAVAIGPWTPVIVLVILVAWLLIRRARKAASR